VQEPYLNSVLEAIAADALDPDGPRLITVDELRVAGALDVPAAWRKSLSAGCDAFAVIDGTLPLFATPSNDVSDGTASAAEPECSGFSRIASSQPFSCSDLES
jgi:hypothetical protein